MRIVITGGAGFLGGRVADRLAALDDMSLILVDHVAPATPPAGATVVVDDITGGAWLDAAFAGPVDGIFHLAAVVSAQAETDFDLGMAVNVDATRALFERCREQATPPRLVFPSSIAAFGPIVGTVDDTTGNRPRNSYGIEKAIGELLLADYSRRGSIDGRCVRLPTITVRPGKPNKAASSFASGIIREPLNGEASVCPVVGDLELWVASPRAAVDALVHAFDTPTAAWGDDRSLNVPGLTTTPDAMVAALGRAGGDTSLVSFERDPAIEAIVATWPGRMETPRADAMGFHRDTDIDALVRAYVEDELGG